MLQGEIMNRFMNHVTNQLQLDQSARGRLEQHLRQSGERRRSLAQRSVQLRREAGAAVRDSTTPEAEFRRLLGEMTDLRQKEEELFTSDQDALGRILTPRQQVQFVFMWLRFNEQVREMARPARRPPRP
jgi:Spy/CpxP family protein refolding chaperone